jgi:chromatin remodeling complex protein RSC6
MATFLTSQNVQAVDGGYTRQTMMKAVSGYIHTHKLQLEENKKEWKPDATLVKLFTLDKTKVYTFMNINGLLSRVVVKAN